MAYIIKGRYMKKLYTNVEESLQPTTGDMVGDHYKFSEVFEAEGTQKVVYKCTHSNAQLILNYQAGEYISGEIKFEDPLTVPSAEDIEMAGQDAENRLTKNVTERRVTFNEVYSDLLI